MAGLTPVNPAVPPLPVTSYGADTAPSYVGGRGRPPPLPPPPAGDGGEAERRELEEGRCRLAQMEKTMRWWSDCTANWRAKWSKVRSERNRLQEECRQLRASLERSSQRCAQLQRDAQTPLVAEPSSCGLQQAAVTKADSRVSRDDPAGRLVSAAPTGTDPKHSTVVKGKVDECKGHGEVSADKEMACEVDDLVVEEMRARLEASQTAVSTQTLENAALVKAMADVKEELLALRSRNDELKLTNRQAAEQSVQCRRDYEDEVIELRRQLEVEVIDKVTHEKRLQDTREQLERLQLENASEWERRERLATAQQAAQRDNKRLRADAALLAERVRGGERGATAASDALLGAQRELAGKVKEVSEMRHANARLRTELHEQGRSEEHARGRATQYEGEVGRLRGRVDELKTQLATAEDEVDQQTNVARRLQRTNDEIQQQAEAAQVRLTHLESRLRVRGRRARLFHKSSSLHSLDGMRTSWNTEDDGSDSRTDTSDD